MNTPTIFILLGATGDLARKKIIPAIFDLYCKKELPRLFRLVGFARSEYSHEGFGDYVVKVLKDAKRGNAKERAEFGKLVNYIQGDFSSVDGFSDLSEFLGMTDGTWKACSNKLFYLSVSPVFYEAALKGLAKSKLTEPCSDDEGWTRVIIEKPFGRDLKTAEKLDALLGKLFREEQIYRVDHYLGKEMLQNILTFRFANTLFSHNWDRHSVAQIDVRLLEKIGVEERGEFYDGIGALRDVGQNHLLQMLALVTMDRPLNFSDREVRRKRLEVLKNLKMLKGADLACGTYRGQYKGYTKVKGVKKTSKTETYFKINTTFTDGCFKGVPVSLEGGKMIGKAVKEVVVTFKPVDDCLCEKDEKDMQNKVIFRLTLTEGIEVEFYSRKPGLKGGVEKQKLDFCYSCESGQKSSESYEKLLLDAINGDQSLYVSTQEVRQMWKFIDPIICGWKDGKVPLRTYDQGTCPHVISCVVEDVRLGAQFDREIGIVGLGKMGAGLAKQLIDKKWKVVGYNHTEQVTRDLGRYGMVESFSLEEMIGKLEAQRKIVWLMVPAGDPVDSTLKNLVKVLRKGDIVIDGGNSFFKDTVKRGKFLKKYGIKYMDCGVSGGPSGARNGACLMIGGDKKLYSSLERLYFDLALDGGYGYMGDSGAGHFVKMVHNGIEYGMMQAIGEGFGVMKKADLRLDLREISRVYNTGSVIESRLMGWLEDGFDTYGVDLTKVSERVAHSGEGLWTVEVAQKMKQEVRVIKDSLQFRQESQKWRGKKKHRDYVGKVVSVLRNMFGGHQV